MGGRENLQLRGAQARGGLLNAFFGSGTQMQAANHGAHGFFAGQMLDVVERVDHAGMSASQEQNNAAAEVNHQRLTK